LKNAPISVLALISVVDVPYIDGQYDCPGQQCPAPCTVHSVTVAPAVHADHVLHVTTPI
jgi:hypothetical protein